MIFYVSGVFAHDAGTQSGMRMELIPLGRVAQLSEEFPLGWTISSAGCPPFGIAVPLEFVSYAMSQDALDRMAVDKFARALIEVAADESSATWLRQSPRPDFLSDDSDVKHACVHVRTARLAAESLAETADFNARMDFFERLPKEYESVLGSISESCAKWRNVASRMPLAAGMCFPVEIGREGRFAVMKLNCHTAIGAWRCSFHFPGPCPDLLSGTEIRRIVEWQTQHGAKRSSSMTWGHVI
jgi:hypothetical protein